MKNWKYYPLVLGCVLLFGCSRTTRSISHSGYVQQHSCWGPAPVDLTDPAFQYRGELSESDVLGIAHDEITSEADIQRALLESRRIQLHPDSSILLIQSGAPFPDGPLVTELSKHFRVIPFSGVPAVHRTSGGLVETESPDPESYSKSLRLIAARGGADFILCYWGMIESETDKLPTKTVSWVPIARWVIPDEKQHMRLRLKAALVEVRSGSWSVFSSKPVEDARITTSPHRAAVDQKQIEQLKKLAYEASVTELVRVFD